MKALKVRKNFIFERETVEKVQEVLAKKHKSLTEAITLYFQALAKEPEILDLIEKQARRRTGSFIGMLDGKIGDEDAKRMYETHARAKESQS